MKVRFLPDTSCMVAATCSWHEDHESAAREISRRLSSGEVMVVAAPALVEAYAVLTRLPAPYRLRPTDALGILDANFMSGRHVVALGAGEYVSFLRGAPGSEVAGGRAYDAVIARCAAKARASFLLTFNHQDFSAWNGKLFRVVVPGSS